MENNEPEANIANIRAALRKPHGIQGVVNYVDASNDSTWIMNKRRDVLVNDLAREVQNARMRITNNLQSDVVDAQVRDDCFHCHFHEEDDVQNLVLDFRLAGDNVDAMPVEAKILQVVLDTTSNWDVISIQGIAGVGKTSIASALSNQKRVIQRFKHRIYLISLGADAARNGLNEALCETIKLAGGRKGTAQMRQSMNLIDTFNGFRSWFEKKECLFMIDDVWETPEISSSIIHEVLKLHRSAGKGSKVLFTTRFSEIASKATGKHHMFVLKPYEPKSPRCRRILTQYSGIHADESNAIDDRAVKDILQKCSGLPLFLKIAGKAVKALSCRSGHSGCAAYHIYSRTLDASTPTLLNTDVDSDERLAATLSRSIRMVVERRKNRWRFPLRLTAAEMHRRLSVFLKRSQVPMNTLKHLWELRSEAEASIIAREFEQIALATIDLEERDGEYIELLRLHDSVHDYALTETNKHMEEELGHRNLLSGYSKGLEREAGCRAWWSRKLEVDGYIHKHICHHLLQAGLIGEMFSLLFKPEWTIRVLQIGGIMDLEPGYTLAMESLSDDEVCSNSNLFTEESERREVAEALRLVLEAARLSEGFKDQSQTEICFQLFGRLKFCRKNVHITEYLSKIDEKALKLRSPWLRSTSPFLSRPGEAMTEIIHIKSKVSCMTLMDDSDRVICGCYDGRIVEVDLERCEIEKNWCAHVNGIRSIAICNSRRLLLTQGWDGTVRIWNLDTEAMIRTFKSNTGILWCSAMTGDGKRVFMGFRDGTVQVRNSKDGVILREFRSHDTAVTCILELSDGERIISGAASKGLRIWSATGSKEEDLFPGQNSCITCVVKMSNGKHIMSGSDDHTIRIWDFSNHQEVGKPFRGHKGPVTCIAVSNDDSRVASGSVDTTVRVWDVCSRREICNPLKGHAGVVTGVVFHPRSHCVISCSIDETVRIWDIRKTVGQVTGHHDKAVTSVTFSSDGLFAASASLDHSVRIWDVQSGRQVGKPLLGHSHDVTGVAITPDGKRVVSVSKDRTMRVWIIESHQLLYTFTSHTDWIDSVAVANTPSGELAVTCSRDHTIRVWNLSTGDNSIVGRYTDELRGSVTTMETRLVCGRVFITDDGLRIILVLLWGVITVWNLKGEVITEKLMKGRRILGMSRKAVMDIVHESCSEADEDISITPGEQTVWYIRGNERSLLGTLEATVCCWTLSPDRTKVCAGLADGHVAIMEVKTGS